MNNKKTKKSNGDTVDKSIKYQLLRSFIDKPKLKSLPYFDTSIPKKFIHFFFDVLRDKFGESELCKEYTIYKYRNLEMTVLPDGSSFCHQVLYKPVQDKNIEYSDFNKSAYDVRVLISINERVKISNDVFPSEYNYDDVIDTIDIIFKWSDKISIVLSTKYQSDNSDNTVTKIKEITRPDRIESSDKLWAEIYLKVSCDCNFNSVHECVNFIEKTIITYNNL
jgi:hypothetical protein